MKIDYAAARSAVLNAIANKGADFIYERINVAPMSGADSCANWVEGPEGEKVPSCIVGHAFSQWNVLDLTDQCDTAPSAVSDIMSMKPEYKFTAKAIDYLDEIQSLQDDGETWGEAERRAARNVASFEAEGLYNADESRSAGEDL